MINGEPTVRARRVNHKPILAECPIRETGVRAEPNGDDNAPDARPPKGDVPNIVIINRLNNPILTQLNPKRPKEPNQDLKSIYTRMNRRTSVRRVPKTTQDLRKTWQPEKKVKTFNQFSFSPKGRIKLDKHTYVEYDYSGEQAKRKLVSKNNPNLCSSTNRENFKLPPFPIFKGFTSQLANPNEPMSLYLLDDLSQAILSRNPEESPEYF